MLPVSVLPHALRYIDASVTSAIEHYTTTPADAESVGEDDEASTATTSGTSARKRKREVRSHVCACDVTDHAISGVRVSEVSTKPMVSVHVVSTRVRAN
jgi:hypothetical protein